jgi:hypothetical protein
MYIFVSCLIVPLPLGKNPFAVQLNDDDDGYEELCLLGYNSAWSLEEG